MSDYFSGRMIFDHLPKTAGTAITTWLEETFGKGTVTPISTLSGPHLDFISKFGGLYPIISGHLIFLYGDDLDPRWKYVTVLREPIDRCLSWLYYLEKDVERNSNTSDQIDGAKAFLESNGIESNPALLDGITNFYVRHFSAINNTAVLNGEVALSAAISNICRYDIVGFYDNLGSFLSDVGELIGISKRLKLLEINKTTSRKRIEEINPLLYARLVELNSLDIEFYNKIHKIKRQKRSWKIGKSLSNIFKAYREFQKFEQTQIGKDLTNRFIDSDIVSDVKGHIVLLESIDTLHPLQFVSIKIEIINQSLQKWGGNIFYPVNASYHWLNTDGNVVVAEGERTSVVSYPGSCSPLTVNVIAPPFSGDFILILTLVQECQFWFEDKGKEFSPAKINVVVAENDIISGDIT